MNTFVRTGALPTVTTTYNPYDPAYFDPADARAERDRVFDLCHGCRLCWNLCPSFGSLFSLIDDTHDGDPHALTPPEHDRIVDECYQCKLCYVKCPYVPPHEWQLDFPRLMLRSLGVRQKREGTGITERFLASTDLMGKAGTLTAPIANAFNHNSAFRGLVEKTIGIAADRLLPDYAHERFTRWFKRRPKAGVTDKRVAVFPTCIVEYQQPAIGKDLVRVCEHNDVGVEVPDGLVCCGMPWLDGGDFDKFTEQALRNVAILKQHVDAGEDIVVPQPTCGYVLKREYPEYLQTDDARAVGAHTYDAAEYLMALRKEGKLDTNFTGATYETITWHVPCHLKAQNVGFKSRDLMALTGAKVKIVDRCSGIDGTWGYRAENQELAKKIARPLGEAVKKADGQCVAGDCHLANGVIVEETGQTPLHPVQVLARAYGIPEE